MNKFRAPTQMWTDEVSQVLSEVKMSEELFDHQKVDESKLRQPDFDDDH